MGITYGQNKHFGQVGPFTRSLFVVVYVLTLYVHGLYIPILYKPSPTYKLHYPSTLPNLAYTLHIPLHQNLTFMTRTNMINEHFIII
jgi:hypothetical protein